MEPHVGDPRFSVIWTPKASIQEITLRRQTQEHAIGAARIECALEYVVCRSMRSRCTGQFAQLPPFWARRPTRSIMWAHFRMGLRDRQSRRSSGQSAAMPSLFTQCQEALVRDCGGPSRLQMIHLQLSCTVIRVRSLSRVPCSGLIGTPSLMRLLLPRPLCVRLPMRLLPSQWPRTRCSAMIPGVNGWSRMAGRARSRHSPVPSQVSRSSPQCPLPLLCFVGTCLS